MLCSNKKIRYEGVKMNNEQLEKFDDYSIEINEDGESEGISFFCNNNSTTRLKITGIISAIYCKKINSIEHKVTIFVEDSLIFNISLPDEQTFSLYESIGELI